MCSDGMAWPALNIPGFLLTILILCPRVSPDVTKMKVLDEFGDEVGVLYYGSTIVFSCKCFIQELCVDSKIELKLMRNGSTNPVDRTMNHTWKSTVEFNVKVDHKFVIDSYYCVIGYNEFDRQKIDYFLCANDHSNCPRDSMCDRTTQRFCVVRRRGPQTCTMLSYDDECAIHSVPTCQTARMVSYSGRTLSLCMAHVENEKAVSAVNDWDMCAKGQAISFASGTTGIELNMGSNIYIRKANNHTMEPLSVACLNVGKFKNVTLCEKNSTGAVLWCEPIARCGQEVPSEKFKNRKGFSRTKLVVTALVKDSDQIASAYIFVVVIGEFSVNLKLPEGECDENRTVKEFDCTFEGLYSHPPEFSVSLGIRLTFESGTSQTINNTDSILGLRNQLVEGPGKHLCTGAVWFTSCSPFDEQMSEVKTEVDLHKSCVPPNLAGGIRIQKVPVTSTALVFGIVVTSILLFTVSTALLLFFSYRRWKKSRREPELIKTMNEGDDENKEHILVAKAIKELTNSLMQSSDNFGAARKYVAHWFGTLEKDNANFVKTNLTVPVKDCKYEDLQCFKHSQIRDLHVNRLNDWRCNPVYLSTAPTKKEFARFWEMIALERIGTIVWVGGFVEKGEARIEPYVSLIQGRTIIFKDDKSPMKANIKTVGVFQHEHRYTTYTIRVRIEASPGHGELKAMVSVMHIPTWPAMDMPPLYQAYNLNEECGFIEGYQQRRGSWPGLLFHCNNGVQKSAAMMVLYICRQIYMERRKVNLMGVIRYVRAARFGAFSYAPSGYIQVPIILTVLGAVDKAVKEDKQMDYSASASSISVASSKSIVSEAKPSPSPKSVDPGHTYLKLSTLSILSVEKLKKASAAKSVVGKEKSTNKASKQAKSPTSSQSPTSKSPVVGPYLYA